MDEFELIQSIKQKEYRQTSLNQGVGDDAAVFNPKGKQVVTAVDTFVEGVHFTKNTMSVSDIGYRALAANLSDLAAMGATPKFYLVSVVIPEYWKSTEIKGIFKGMNELAIRYEIDLIGGDTVSGNELCISITVIGYALMNRLRYRNLSKPDDVVFVTGTLGDSRAGLYLLLHESIPNYVDFEYFINRHRRPTPRVLFSNHLEHLERIAFNDVSDGIASEANELAEASGVDLFLYDEFIPVHPKLKEVSRKNADEWKYMGGEDFELLGTVSAEDFEEVQRIAHETNTMITKIGTVHKKKNDQPRVMLNKENHFKRLEKTGYVHLK